MSYSQIKKELGVSKSALAKWLNNYPLAIKEVSKLGTRKEKQIERCRETKRKKKEERLAQVAKLVNTDLGELSNREIIVAGYFLYWGEGTKSTPCVTSVSNTDPAVIKFFLKWIQLLGVPYGQIRIYVHLYSDMDIEGELQYWSDLLEIPRSAFRKPYVKKSKRENITYRQRFIHGTCNVLVSGRDLQEYVIAALENIRARFADEGLM